MSVLVSGSLTIEFIPKKGLREGDPLASFLFLIVVEDLVWVSRKAVQKNLFESLEVGRRKVKVNMLQFAYNTLFFCEANIESVFNLKVIFYCFELAYGFKVNFSKIKLGGVRVDQTVVLRFVTILNCDVTKTPFIYLGLSVVGCHKKSVFWDGVVDRINNRLSKWKGRFILMDGRICLIKFVLLFILLFYLSLFKIPSTVLKKIVFLQRNILWVGVPKGGKLHGCLGLRCASLEKLVV